MKISDWVKIVEMILIGISNFLTSFFNILTGSLNPEAVEGILALFAISIIYRIFNGGVNYNFIRRKKDEDDEEEWVLVRRRR